MCCFSSAGPACIFSFIRIRRGNTGRPGRDKSRHTPGASKSSKNVTDRFRKYHKTLYFEKEPSLNVTEAFAATEPLKATAAEAPTGTAEA